MEQLEKALMALRGTSVEAKYRSLFSVLDEDHDGNIKLEEVAEVTIIYTYKCLLSYKIKLSKSII